MWAYICALQVFVIIVRIPVLSAQWQTTGLAQCWYQSQYLLLVLWHHLAAVLLLQADTNQYQPGARPVPGQRQPAYLLNY